MGFFIDDEWNFFMWGIDLFWFFFCCLVDLVMLIRCVFILFILFRLVFSDNLLLKDEFVELEDVEFIFLEFFCLIFFGSFVLILLFIVSS